MNEAKQERRRAKRVAMVVRVRTIRDDEEHFLRSENVSMEGLFLHTIAPFPLNTELILEFELPTGREAVVVRGVVQRINPVSPDGWVPGMGIRFSAFMDSSREQLRHFVDGRHDEASGS